MSIYLYIGIDVMCLFCDIIKKEKGAKIVYENDAVVAVLDVMPIAPGHTLVLPKKHVETILELSDEALGAVFGATREVTELLKRALEPDGFTIGINHGKASGQAIEHLHIHIIPRWRDDGGGSLHSVMPKKTQDESIDEIYEKIVAKK